MCPLEDRFDLEPPLYRGQVASAYPARQKGLERKVLLKIIHPHLADDAELRERFLREGKTLAQINHPNIVKVFDQGESDGTLYLALEWVDGGTLAERIQSGPLEQTTVKHIAEDILKGLSAVHRQGLIHRDLKPDNILLDSEGRALLADFSLAGFSHPSNLTGHGVLIGSPAYFAPELIEGAPASPQSDLWAVGVILLEALTGSNPFYNPDPILTLDLVRKVSPPRLTGHPAIDVDLARLTDTLLQTNPQIRPKTAEEALDILLTRGSTPLKEAKRLNPLKLNIKFNYQWLGGVAALVLIIATTLLFITNKPNRIQEDNFSSNFADTTRTNENVLSREKTSTIVPPETQEQVKTTEVNSPGKTVSIPGSAVIKVQPWAEVWVDGDSLGITQLGIVPLSEGGHKVLLKHPVLPEYSINLQIKSGEQTSLEIDLYKTSARLEVTAAPWGYLWLDEDSLGLLPRLAPIWIKPGLYKIRVQHPTLPELTDSINVAAGIVHSYKFDLNAGTMVASNRNGGK